MRSYDIQKDRFEVAICQRHLRLLGRDIDLNSVLSQYIMRHLKRDLSVALSKFESQSLQHIIDFNAVIQVLRLTCSLMMKAGLSLLPFDMVPF